MLMQFSEMLKKTVCQLTQSVLEETLLLQRQAHYGSE